MSSKITTLSSDKELILEIKNGNKNAFKTLFNGYYIKLVDFCFYRTKNLEISKDHVQELFAKIWAARNRLDPDKSTKSYLYKSLVNQIINQKKLSSSKNISLEETISANIIASNTDLENKIDIYTAIEKLPEKLKTVFMLSRIEGFHYTEIAEICKISVKAVEKRMTKALKILRKDIAI